MSPRHPWLKMFETFSNRRSQRLDIIRLITAHDESVCFDAIGGIFDELLGHFFFVDFLLEVGFLLNAPNSADNSFSSPTCPLKYSFMNCERRSRNAIGATALRSSVVTSSRPSAAAYARADSNQVISARSESIPICCTR